MTRLKIASERFWKLTYQEFWIEFLGFYEREEKELWQYGDMKAHIANCLTKKEGGGIWTYKDFVTLPSEKAAKPKRITLKETRQLLGSTFKMNSN